VKSRVVRFDLAGAGLSVAKGGAGQIEAPFACPYMPQQCEYIKKACQNSKVGESGTHVNNYV